MPPPWLGWLACRSALNKSCRNACRSWAMFAPDVVLLVAAVPVLEPEPAAAPAVAAALAVAVLAVVAAAVAAVLALPLDWETAWVSACSSAVNRLLLPLLLLAPAAPVGPE